MRVSQKLLILLMLFLQPFWFLAQHSRSPDPVFIESGLLVIELFTDGQEIADHPGIVAQLSLYDKGSQAGNKSLMDSTDFSSRISIEIRGK